MSDKSVNKATWSRLAMQLHVSGTAIANWRSIEGAPTEPDVEKWKAFIADKKLGKAGNKLLDTREQLIQDTKKREIKLLDLKIAEAERKKVSREEVNQMLKVVAMKQKSLFFQVLGRELGARCVGKSAGEINDIGKSIALRFCEIFSQDTDKWDFE